MIYFNANVKLFPGGKIPQYMTRGAAAADCFVRKVEVEEIDPKLAIVTYYLGFALEINSDFNIHLYARSSSYKKKHVLTNGVGIGDPDYRGEYKAVFYVYPNAEGNFEFYEVGDRCCQMQINGVYKMEFNEVDELNETERGEGGFGSTGN